MKKIVRNNLLQLFHQVSYSCLPDDKLAKIDGHNFSGIQK